MTESSRTKSNIRTSTTLRSDSRSAGRGSRSRSAAELNSGSTPAHWFPVWAPVLVMLAVIGTGLVLGKGDNTIPHSFFVLFAIAVIVSTLFVEPRGLFLTVASFPPFYLLGSLIVGWVSSGSATVASRKTKVITSIYPAIEHFMWLLIPFFIAVLIALFRWWNYRESLTRQAVRLEMQRRRRSESDRSNIESYSRAKERSQARSHSYKDKVYGSSRDGSDATTSTSTYRSEQPRRHRRPESPESDWQAAHRTYGGSGESDRAGGYTRREESSRPTESADRADRGEATKRTNRIPRGADFVPAPYHEDFDEQEHTADRDQHDRPGHNGRGNDARPDAGREAYRVTRSPEELRNSAQQRRIPLPERRRSPKHYLDGDRD